VPCGAVRNSRHRGSCPIGQTRRRRRRLRRRRLRPRVPTTATTAGGRHVAAASPHRQRPAGEGEAAPRRGLRRLGAGTASGKQPLRSAWGGRGRRWLRGGKRPHPRPRGAWARGRAAPRAARRRRPRGGWPRRGCVVPPLPGAPSRAAVAAPRPPAGGTRHGSAMEAGTWRRPASPVTGIGQKQGRHA